jgi:hypothetical protein
MSFKGKSVVVNFPFHGALKGQCRGKVSLHGAVKRQCCGKLPFHGDLKGQSGGKGDWREMVILTNPSYEDRLFGFIQAHMKPVSIDQVGYFEYQLFKYFEQVFVSFKN